MVAVLSYPVPGLGQQTSPGPDPRIATWQGRTRIAGVRAMRQMSAVGLLVAGGGGDDLRDHGLHDARGGRTAFP
jgi:hypothetical protein